MSAQKALQPSIKDVIFTIQGNEIEIQESTICGSYYYNFYSHYKLDAFDFDEFHYIVNTYGGNSMTECEFKQIYLAGDKHINDLLFTIDPEDHDDYDFGFQIDNKFIGINEEFYDTTISDFFYTGLCMGYEVKRIDKPDDIKQEYFKNLPSLDDCLYYKVYYRG